MYIFDDDYNPQGSGRSNAKLDEESVRKYRREYKAAQVRIMALRKKHSIASYAKKANVGVSTMERALIGKSWTHV